MKRFMLRVAYDGTNYHGWQAQNNAETVEQKLNEALTRLTGEPIAVIGASRTDAGVHALDNVAVFDSETTIPGEKLMFAVQPYLPDDIIIQYSCQAPDTFHPRFCKTRKTYEYQIDNGMRENPKCSRYSYHVREPLDTDAMNAAGSYLIGTHDFAAFCAAGAQVATTVRTIYSCAVEREDSMVYIQVTGNGFLYNMVRIIAGTLIRVGQGAWEPERVLEALESLDRTKAGPTAPAKGLTLQEIQYDEED